MTVAGKEDELPGDLPPEIRETLVAMDFTERLEKARAKRASVLAEKRVAGDGGPATPIAMRTRKRSVGLGLVAAGIVLAVSVPLVAERFGGDQGVDIAQAAGQEPEQILGAVEVSALDTSLRPEPKALDVSVAPEVVERPEARAVPTDTMEPGVLKVRMFVAKGARGKVVRQRITSASHEVIKARGTKHDIKQTHVKFFDPADAEAANALAAKLRGVARLIAKSDRPAGTVDVWVSPAEWPHIPTVASDGG